jgi:diacylglycerol kinase (ATP)
VTRALVIVNPAAGGGRTARLWPSLGDELARLGLTFDVALTARPGDATVLAREAPIDDLVVAVGGDGTLNEVVNGVVDPTRPPRAVAAVLTGRGRDACRNLGIARDPRAAARQVVHGVERLVDVGRAEWPAGAQRYFVGAAGAGFDAAVALRAAARPGSGTVPYLLAVVACIRTHVPADVEVTVDGGVPWRGAVTAAVIANGPHYGGGMRIAPAADPADGALDVVVVGALGRAELLRWLPALYRGTHLRHPRVWTVRARHVSIGARALVPTHLDGEVTAAAPVTVSVCAGALRLRA